MNSANDGVFWMSIEDFCKEYQDLTVSYVDEDYYYSSLKITPSKRIFRVAFEVKYNQRSYFTVTQTDKRFFDEKSNYTPTLISFIVYRVEPDQKKTFVAENSDTSRDVFKELKLTPGTYEV